MTKTPGDGTLKLMSVGEQATEGLARTPMVSRVQFSMSSGKGAVVVHAEAKPHALVFIPAVQRC